jgi:siroheme synthase-like protein
VQAIFIMASSLYPLFLNLSGRDVLLIGAGEVALQKIRTLLPCGAKLHVVAPEATLEIQQLASGGELRWSARAYQPSDLEGAAVVFAATDDRAIQKRVAAEARERRILVNIVDVPALCDFYAAATVQRGDIQIAISTGGAAPALAKYLRGKIEALVGEEYADFARIVGPRRSQILALPKERRKQLWERLASDLFLAQIKREGAETVARQVDDWIQNA